MRQITNSSALTFALFLAIASYVPIGCAATPAERTGTTTSSSSDQQISVEDLRSDLEALYSGLREAHYDLYARVSQEAYDAHYRQTLESLDVPLTPFEAQVAFQRFAAFARMGHCRIESLESEFARHRNAGGRALPLYIRVIDGRVFVSEFHGGSELVQGDEILAVNGQPATDFLARLVAHLSADSDYLAHALLELRFPEIIWLELGDVDSVEFTIRRADDSRTTVRVASAGREALEGSLEGAKPALELDWMARESRMLDGSLAYLRPGPFYEPSKEDIYDPTAFRAFIDEAFESFLEARATTLLIDLRNNPGGDASFSDPMIAWFADKPFRFNSAFRIRVSPQTVASNQQRIDLANGEPAGISSTFKELLSRHESGDVVPFEIPLTEPREGRRFAGEVFVLVNRHTFSNAVSAAAIMKDYRFARVLGEETADVATGYGAMEHFVLPATGFRVGYPKALIVRPNGDERSLGVKPDLAIVTPLFESADDPVLEAAIGEIRRLGKSQ